MAKKETYPIYVSNGLLDDGHPGRIGNAIWVFLWLIDRTTSEVDGWGLVLGGAPIKAERISKALGRGFSVRTVKEHLRVLRDGGYIKNKRLPYGLQIMVAKSKKFRKRSAESCTSEKGEVQKPSLPEVQNSAGRSAETCPCNKTVQETVQLDSTEKKETDLPSFLSPQTWSDFLEHRKKLKAPMSNVAQTRAIQKLTKYKEQGFDPEDIVNESIVNGWKGLFPPKQTKGGGAAQSKTQREREAIMNFDEGWS